MRETRQRQVCMVSLYLATSNLTCLTKGALLIRVSDINRCDRDDAGQVRRRKVRDMSRCEGVKTGQACKVILCLTSSNVRGPIKRTFRRSMSEVR